MSDKALEEPPLQSTYISTVHSIGVYPHLNMSNAHFVSRTPLLCARCATPPKTPSLWKYLLTLLLPNLPVSYAHLANQPAHIALDLFPTPVFLRTSEEIDESFRTRNKQ
jgi:hypothetical protein